MLDNKSSNKHKDCIINQELQKIQDFIKNNNKINLNIVDFNYSGIEQYYPEELVLVVRAGTNNLTIKKTLKQHNQGLDFWADDNLTIGQSYIQGGSDMRDNILGVDIIDGRGDFLSFGGQVMKNVAGYDVSRLLCGAKDCCVPVLLKIKILPLTNIKPKNKPVLKPVDDDNILTLAQEIKNIFDPFDKFE